MQKSPQSLFISRIAVACVTLIASLATATYSSGQGADLIWTPKHESGDVPAGNCYFRKKFTLINPEKAEMFIVADDTFELYINGQMVQRGSDADSVFEMNVESFLKPGVNLVSIKVQNFHGNTAGVAMKLRVKERNENRWRSLETDNTWKTRTAEIPSWKSSGYDDIGWLAASVVQPDFLTKNGISAPQINPRNEIATAKNRSTGASTRTQASSIPAQQASTNRNASTGSTQSNTYQTGAASNLNPQDESADQTKSQATTEAGTYDLDPEFRLQQLLTAEQTGSVIAIEFNEVGNVIFSQEGGPLKIADLTLPLENPDRVRLLCDEVTSCQGILPINGDLYVTGDGPNGLGLYRLGGKDKNGRMSVQQTVLRFQGEMGEHGPHGLQLGPDGMIYCVIGNGSGVKNKAAKSSPYQHTYEGDLVPRYEDPGGHATGVKAPGGTIIRLTLDGKKVETVAGGLRNAYDLVFDKSGDLFIHDSDMESDMGMTWYRPTMISHVVDGAELGWRSGWAKFPEYFADVTPAAARTGRGSPTGAVCYQHLQYPARFHNALFFADWSEGRILVAKPTETGTSKSLTTSVFLSGKPLNVTDLAVGEDGAIYFATGGRGTTGGLFRIIWNGKVPAKLMRFESELAKIIRHPQPNSAWARQNIAKIKKSMGQAWKDDIEGVAKETRNSTDFRNRALDLLVLHGPFPSTEFLTSLANDENERVRAKVASICGLRPGNRSVLDNLIADSSGHVRRHACEAFLRLNESPKTSQLLEVLASKNRFETVAARRLLERIPADQWMATILNTDDKRTFINASLAAVTAQPTLERSYRILARCSEFMNGYVSDADFIDMLRLMQLTLIQGKVEPKNVPAFAERVEREFPSGSGLLNRELARLLAFLKTPGAEDRFANYFETSKDSEDDKTHVAMFLQTIGSSLSDSARIAVINHLESAKKIEGGGSYELYLTRAIKDVADTMTDDQVSMVIANGDQWPTALISAYYKLPMELDEQTIAQIIDLDSRLQKKKGPAFDQARIGVIAVLAQGGGDTEMEYLRTLWKNEKDRRGDIAIGLAQKPNGENWPYLVSSLPVLDDTTSVEVLSKLTQVELRPKSPKFYQHVLELGYRLENEGANLSAKLIEHWSGEKAQSTSGGWKANLNRWKKWYEAKFPEGPSIEVPQVQKVGRYSVSQVMDYLNQKGSLGDAERGHQLFTRVQCAKCHRYGSFGDSLGPDLTSVAKRFSKREIIEAIVAPSKVVPEQYRTQTILTQSGTQLTGMLVSRGDGYTVLQSDGKKIQVPLSEVDEIKQNAHSSMPEGLLDELAMDEIRDLFTYIYSSSPDRFAEEAKTVR